MSEAFKNAWHHVRSVTSEEMQQAAREAERQYGDIIDLPHPVSKKHPPLSMEQKAAQYSPFAALTGYEEIIDETARLTDERPVLTEDRKRELDEALSRLRAQISREPEAKITFFVPDLYKSGGSLITVTGRVRTIDQVHRKILLSDGREIATDDITDLCSSLL